MTQYLLMRISGKNQIPIGFISNPSILERICERYNQSEVNFRIFTTSNTEPYLRESRKYNSPYWNKRANYQRNRP